MEKVTLPNCSLFRRHQPLSCGTQSRNQHSGVAVMAAPKKATTPKQNGNSTTNRPVAVMPKSSASAHTGNLEELVRRRAYEIYESTGRQDGRAEEHWLQAEAEVRQRTA